MLDFRDHVVVLDVDDTLYLERDYVRSGFAAVGASIGVEAFGNRCWELFCRGVRGTTFDDAKADLGVETPTAELVAVYRAHTPTITLQPDAERLLRLLRPERSAVITDGPLESQQAKVAALGIAVRVGPVVYSAHSSVGHSKPHPAAYLAAQRSFEAGSRFVYVADNPHKDFHALADLGWDGVRIRRPGSLHEDAEGPDSIPVIVSLDEIVV